MPDSESPPVYSPYGKDSLTELRQVFGFNSVQSAVSFITQHILQNYPFQRVSVTDLHIAGGLTARIRAWAETTPPGDFYLKFTSHTVNACPEEVFPWLAYAYQYGIPFPRILQTKMGNWYLNPRVSKDYDRVYLMQALPGQSLRVAHPVQLNQYARMMAGLHRLGLKYPAPFRGKSASWNDRWSERKQFWQFLQEIPFLNSVLLTHAWQVIEDTGLQLFSQSMLHGDFRLCHVLFHNSSLNGIIDLDEATWGERWVDYCYGLISSGDPQRAGLLDYPALVAVLQTYHQNFPLSETDRRFVQATFTYAILETIVDITPSVQSGAAPIEDVYTLEGLLRDILQYGIRLG
jgi:aminoglycoside phosphotransferase